MHCRTLLKMLLVSALAAGAATDKDWQSTFSVRKESLGVKGSNPWFPLTSGYVLSYAHGKDRDTLTVLSETKVIDGVETRVVEDRELKNDKLVELTRDYYAIDSATNDVYYFGEEVDVYKNGKVAGHGGSWLSGVKGAKFGLMMPGQPRPGQRFYQEQAPGVGMDRVEIVANHETLSTPAGQFADCLHVVETSPLEKGMRDHKWYASGVGPVKDGEMVLVKYGVQ
jgi:hypothetical protein